MRPASWRAKASEAAFDAYGGKPQPTARPHIAVKEAVFPFARFPGVDTLLGPEMRSTGEVMGLDYDYALAFAKAQLGAGVELPREGTVFVSVRDEDKGARSGSGSQAGKHRLQGHGNRRHAEIPRSQRRRIDQD